MNRRYPLIRIFSAIMVVLTSCVVLAGPLAPYAYAQPEEPPPVAGGGVPVAVTANVGDAAKSVYTTILTQITRALVIAFFNAAQLFAGRLAYEAANYIASGGQGQGAQFFTKKFGDNLQDVGKDAFAEGMGSLSDSTFFKTVGFNLCKPNAGSLLRLQLSLGNFFPGVNGAFERPKPRCEFKNVIDNWDSFGSSLEKGDLYNVIDANLDTSKSDIGVSASILSGVTVGAAAKISDATKQREEGKGFKSVQSMISGRIKTPAEVVSESTKEEVIRKPNATQIQQTGTILANAFKEGPIQLASYTASVFLNTLASKFMKRIFEKGLGAFDYSEAVQNNVVGSPDSVVTSGKTDVRTANLDLKTPNLQKVSDFEVVVELVACPQQNRGLWNCSVDQKFAQAIQSQGEQGAFTVGEAMDRDFLHKKWKLIPVAMTKETQDANCYNYAYCAGNLQKLRVARILPVGFELAANAPENVDRCRGAGGCATLEEVVLGFSVCNPNGERDATHPWCHLIDPNWAITSPPQQCVLTGFGENLLSAQLNQRREECQDIQTCLKRNNAGECVGGYGYCMAEKTAYRIQAIECSERYASCRNYQPRLGQAVSYLRNTLDYAQCNADNVGCLWYATERDPKNASQNAWVGTTSTGPRIYFDKTVLPCSASDEGCTKMFTAKAGESALNLLLNPSFERTAGTSPPSLADWLPDTPYTVLTVTTGTAAVDGAAALELSPLGAKHQFVKVIPSRIYTLSLYARVYKDADQGSVKAGAAQFQDDFNQAILNGRDFRSAGCEPGPGILMKSRSPLNSAWQRYECSFLTASTTKVLDVFVTGDPNIKVLVDGAELEEGEFATNFVDGLAKGLNETSMKIAPDEYNCQGEKTDHAICAKFAKVCRQSEAGCDGYTDVVGAGTEIPAIVSQNDFCFDTCVGYSEYRKTPSSFDLVHDVDPRFDDATDTGQEYFIPSTAQACSQEDVGCEAFTNIEPSVGGGERQAFFSYVRACEKPSQSSKTFFTWEGSDTTGFQLRTWSLKLDIAPHFSEPGGGPAILLKRGPDQITFKDSSACNETTWKTGFDADCRQFYDADGHVFYRYFSQTILSSDQCATYRLNGSHHDDCEKTGGTFNGTTGECLYQVYAPESRTCNAQAVSCRAYAGAESGNVETVFSDNFRANTSTFTNGTRSSESLLVGDSSWKIDAVNKVAQTSVNIKSSEKDLFRVTFWAKAPVVKAPTTLLLSVADPADRVNKRSAAGSVQITPDWQRFSIGPVSAWRGSTSTFLVWSAVTDVMFLDEVTVAKIPDMAYVRANTWVTPNECDTSLGGVPQPRAMLGCRAYQNRDKQTLNLRQFTRLCRQEAISCKEFIDTRNSDEVGAKTFVMQDVPPVSGFGASTTTRPADRYRYLIDDPAKHCQPENASCRAFGKPKLTPDRLKLDSATPFSTVYFKDDITKYDQALCKPSEIFCEQFTGPAGKEYFRNPGDHACEYKANQALTPANSGIANLASGSYSGWFQKGSTIPCYPQFLESGQTFQLIKNGDTEYQGWGGLCPQEAGECTEIRDPNDTSDPLHRTGKPYFYIYDPEKFDTASCGGEVNVGKGCVLLNNLGDSQSKWSVGASYAKYQNNNFNSTAPVDCTTNQNDPVCKARLCQGTEQIDGFDVNDQPVLGATSTNPWISPFYCTSNQDCHSKDTHVVNRNNGVVREVRTITGFCSLSTIRKNDTNLLLKVNIDRDCSQWLGCRSAETVLDRNTNKYKDVCTNLALCDKASETPGDIFCAHYVNRGSTSTEPVLTRGALFDINRYSHRKVGLGEKDYSGYTMPDAFQVTDLMTARVGAEGVGELKNNSQQSNKNRFALEYRLTAAAWIRMIKGDPGKGDALYKPDPNPTTEEAHVLDPLNPADKILKEANPQLNLCQHVGTGIIGYYRKDEFLDSTGRSGKPVFCYLPVRVNEAKDFVSTLADRFTFGPNPTNDPALNLSFPRPECRANPEADAPYPANFVTAWDISKSPPQPTAKLQEFASANTCEYGEDCSCAYKRVEYSSAGISKFYHPLSQNLPPGICSGGPRNGQTCIPDVVFQVQTVNDVSKKAVLEANIALSCGPPEQGGRCVALDKVHLVSGTFGQCLERDMTRDVGNDKSQHPCLTWNPTPILFGEKDPYHYVPTAGYLPPENSGQYYCVSKADPPSSERLVEGAFNLPGTMTVARYHDDYTSDAHDFLSSGNLAGADLFDNQKPEGSAAANQCERIDGDQADGGNNHDDQAIRLVGTGRDIGKSYTETFFSLTKPIPEAKGISFIRVLPFVNPNGKGRLGCGYQADWVDELGDVDYGDEDNVKKKDKEWQDKFLQNYSPNISKGSGQTDPPGEKVLADGGNRALVMPCSAGTCFTKTWETGYHSKGQTQFISFYDQDNPEGIKRKSFEDLRNSPYARSCGSDKPYFAIRAVFQARTDKGPGTIVASDVDKAPSIHDPWQFVGFWVTSCAGKVNDNRFIYMYADVSYGSICTDLAEVRSRDSKQDSAFTDRVWKSSNYTAPGVGFQYNSRFAPFSSALNTAPAGKDPLFQTGAELRGFSPLHPPTFLGAGVGTYYRNSLITIAANGGCDIHGEGCNLFQTLNATAPPADPWGHLTNLFARIYRLYHWNDQKSRYEPWKWDAALQDNWYGRPCFQNGEDSGDEFCGLMAYHLNDEPPLVHNDPKSGKFIVEFKDKARKLLSSLDQTNPSAMLGLVALQDILDRDFYAGKVRPPLPTDVTLGHYTPAFLGFHQLYPGIPPYDSVKRFPQQGAVDFTTGKPIDFNNPKVYSYLSYYTPRPPRLAAPDLKRCSAPGQCAIQRMDMMSFDNQSEGIVNAGGGMHKAAMRFYAWAAHDQMPLRTMVVDWGDGAKQELPDAKLKNHKPLCATQSECSDPIRGSGITCNTDSDCPPGAGKCAPLGNCNKHQNITCHTDDDCTSGKDKDACIIRTSFGNSTEACEANYFEFNHLYTCGGQASLPNCSFYLKSGNDYKKSEAYCSRNPNKGCLSGEPANSVNGCASGDICIPAALAPAGGCWDAKSNSCRFTPRVYLEDNWGWCTGECRTKIVNGQMQDDINGSNNGGKGINNDVLHPNGGCYAWKAHGSDPESKIGFNVKVKPEDLPESECKYNKYPTNSLGNIGIFNLRPWIVYPGSLQLRSSGELQEEPAKEEAPPPAPFDCGTLKLQQDCEAFPNHVCEWDEKRDPKCNEKGIAGG